VKVLHTQGPFRFVEKGILENGMPDYRLQEQDYYNRKWFDVYLFDNQMQCLLAMEDQEYPKWLTGKPCYIKDSVSRKN
jgi:hypothetical protein|tara:strand:+ start:167 stop:400 length:234 start_codon:yes stop_codon:yes gene_type:complete